MSYTQYKDGYAIETTFKDGTTIDDAADLAYLLGAISQESDWPSPQFPVHYTATGVNTKEVGANLLWKGQADCRGMLGFLIQNGIPIWLAMGKSSTGAGPPYTHTITPTTDGSQLPSIVIQHEEKGSATDEEYQFQGVKVDSMMLSHDLGTPERNYLMCKLEIKAGKVIDPAFALTNDPALPAAANTSPYVNLTRTWDYGGTPLSLDGLTNVEVIVANGLTPLYAHSYDTGTYTGQWPWGFLEAQRKAYRINLITYLNTIERALFDELLATANTKDLLLKWTRSATDYIQVLATDCQVTSVSKKTNPQQVVPEDVILEPRALTWTVVDSIPKNAGGTYVE